MRAIIRWETSLASLLLVSSPRKRLRLDLPCHPLSIGPRPYIVQYAALLLCGAGRAGLTGPYYYLGCNFRRSISSLGLSGRPSSPAICCASGRWTRRRWR